MTRAGIIPLSSIERIQIYTKGCKSTKANLKKILKETGGDFITNGSIFLRNGKPCCHLRADGKTLCTPNYKAWAIAWTEPSEYGVKVVPNTDKNYMECVHIIIDGKKIDPINCGADMKYKTHRVAHGTKQGQFAYYATQDNLSPEQLRDRLFEMGWDNAIMMDGGGSACFIDKNGDGFIGDGRYIPFFIVVHLKEIDIEPKGEKPVVEIYSYSKKKDGSTYLTKNFQVKEFACSDGTDTIFIARQLPMVCQYIRSRVGKSMSINSAYRTPAKNKAVGGAEDSQHLHGTAADLATPPGWTPTQLALVAREIMPNWGGVGIYSWGIHIDVREDRADWNG